MFQYSAEVKEGRCSCGARLPKALGAVVHVATAQAPIVLHTCACGVVHHAQSVFVGACTITPAPEAPSPAAPPASSSPPLHVVRGGNVGKRRKP